MRKEWERKGGKSSNKVDSSIKRKPCEGDVWKIDRLRSCSRIVLK